MTGLNRVLQNVGVLIAALVLFGSLATAGDRPLDRSLRALRKMVEIRQSHVHNGDRVRKSMNSLPEAYIHDAALHFNVPRSLVRSVLIEESAGNQFALSSKGAIGYMQLLPSTAKGLAVNPHDPRENVWGGTMYLSRLFDRYKNWETAITAYHAGPTRVDENRVGPLSRRYSERVLRRWETEKRRERKTDGS